MLTRPDKNEVILNIRANPADPEIFELFYCADCGQLVACGGLFPMVEQQTEHIGHNLARLPGQDSALPGYPVQGHIRYWLESYRPALSPERYNQLYEYASTTGSQNWVWLLGGPEQTNWLAYLNDYLDRLAEAWLDGLEGRTSTFFPDLTHLWVAAQAQVQNSVLTSCAN